MTMRLNAKIAGLTPLQIKFKVCTKCKKRKKVTSFQKGNGFAGRMSNCKKCTKLYAQNYYIKNRKRILKRTYAFRKKTPKTIIRDYSLKAHYGITLKQYEEIFKKQNKRCAVCGTKNDKSKNPWHLDHDHKTGIIRGILCSYCNRGLGYLYDNIVVLKLAIKYLNKKRTGGLRVSQELR